MGEADRSDDMSILTIRSPVSERSAHPGQYGGIQWAAIQVPGADDSAHRLQVYVAYIRELAPERMVCIGGLRDRRRSATVDCAEPLSDDCRPDVDLFEYRYKRYSARRRAA